ncbi:MAG TPA: FAD-dependent oxidoreductase [Deltaproteobacteria bacterium]|nr:FAD-dependent oxidoreductase [Deltaproteobacteria bacterium]
MHKKGITLKTRHEVLSIHREKKKVEVKDLESGRTFEQEYSKLVIATGARAIMPPLPGIDLKEVFPMKEFQDGIDLKAFIEREKPKKGVIIGGGYIGVEVADSFRNIGMEVCVIEAMPRIMAIMDDDMSELVAGEMRQNSVEIITGKKVVGIEGDDHVSSVRLEDGTVVETDCVLMSIGVAPRSEIADQAGLELGARKAIKVDRYLRTSDPDIYAAGDCSTVYHRLLCEHVFIPLGLTANRQGRMCGENIVSEITGRKLKPFPGIIGTAVTKVFAYEIAKTGIGQADIDRYGLRHISSVKIKAKNLPGYFPGASDLWLKLYFEDESKVIVGGQIIGRTGSALRINALVAAITKSMRLDELYTLDMAYAPPFSPVWDPLLIAAKVGMK